MAEVRREGDLLTSLHQVKDGMKLLVLICVSLTAEDGSYSAGGLEVEQTILIDEPLARIFESYECSLTSMRSSQQTAVCQTFESCCHFTCFASRAGSVESLDQAMIEEEEVGDRYR